jgi:hypothetical protein
MTGASIFGFRDGAAILLSVSRFPRQKKSSHCVYKTPWQGDPRINIQNDKGKAKAYQVKQVLLIIEKLEINHGTKKR